MRRLLLALAAASLMAACAGDSTSAPPIVPTMQTMPTNTSVPQPFPRYGVAGVIPPHFPNSSGADYTGLYASIPETGGLLGVYTNWYDAPATAGQVPAVFVATQAAAQEGKFSTLMQIGVNRESPQGHVSTVDWGNPAEVEKLRQTAVAIVQRFRPTYLGIGGEMNRLWESDKAAWDGFISAWPTLYDTVKAASPETKVFTVFQLETLKGKAFLDGRSATRQPEWELLKAFGERLDVVAFTTYPFFDYGSPTEVPDDYYREITRYTSRPIAFTEIGWPSAPLSSAPASPYGGSPEEQAAFAQRFFELTRELNALFSLWAFPNDITGAGVSFESLALRTTEGRPKPALAVWRSFVSGQAVPAVRPIPTAALTPSPSATPMPTRPPMATLVPPTGTARPMPPLSTPTPIGGALGPCGAQPFSVAPVRVEHLSHLSPIATLVPPDHTFPTPHMYFYVKNEATPNDIEVPIYAPGNLLIDSIALRNYTRLGGKNDYTDYTLTFKVCAELEGYFHHIRSLTHPALQQALRAQSCVPQGTSTEKFCSFPATIRVSAGEQIGTTGDKVAGVGGLDLGVRDYRLANGRSGFANPARWCRAGARHNVYEQCYTACPLDYLPAVVRQQYLGLFYDSPRTINRTDEPRCGDFYTDRAGTAQGRWYSATNTQLFTEAPHLYAGPSAFSGVVQAFSMGTSVADLRPRSYLFLPRESGLVNRRFGEIRDNQVYCYERFHFWAGDVLAGRNADVSQTILVQLVSDGRLLVERRAEGACGAGPWMLSAGAAAFVR